MGGLHRIRSKVRPAPYSSSSPTPLSKYGFFCLQKSKMKMSCKCNSLLLKPPCVTLRWASSLGFDKPDVWQCLHLPCWMIGIIFKFGCWRSDPFFEEMFISEDKRLTRTFSTTYFICVAIPCVFITLQCCEQLWLLKCAIKLDLIGYKQFRFLSRSFLRAVVFLLHCSFALFAFTAGNRQMDVKLHK